MAFDRIHKIFDDTGFFPKTREKKIEALSQYQDKLLLFSVEDYKNLITGVLRKIYDDRIDIEILVTNESNPGLTQGDMFHQSRIYLDKIRIAGILKEENDYLKINRLEQKSQEQTGTMY